MNLWDLKIGDTIWLFDFNKRVYRRKGQSAPIYRGHFNAVKIVGETSRSWIIDHYDRKIPKRGTKPTDVYLTEAEINDAEWVNSYRHHIQRQIGMVSDANTLRQIAQIIGYSPDRAER